MLRTFNRHQIKKVWYPSPRFYRVSVDCAEGLGKAIIAVARGEPYGNPPGSWFDFLKQYEAREWRRKPEVGDGDDEEWTDPYAEAAPNRSASSRRPLMPRLPRKLSLPTRKRKSGRDGWELPSPDRGRGTRARRRAWGTDRAHEILDCAECLLVAGAPTSALSFVGFHEQLFRFLAPTEIEQTSSKPADLHGCNAVARMTRGEFPASLVQQLPPQRFGQLVFSDPIQYLRQVRQRRVNIGVVWRENYSEALVRHTVKPLDLRVIAILVEQIRTAYRFIGV